MFKKNLTFIDLSSQINEILSKINGAGTAAGFNGKIEIAYDPTENIDFQNLENQKKYVVDLIVNDTSKKMQKYTELFDKGIMSAEEATYHLYNDPRQHEDLIFSYSEKGGMIQSAEIADNIQFTPNAAPSIVFVENNEEYFIQGTMKDEAGKITLITGSPPGQQTDYSALEKLVGSNIIEHDIGHAIGGATLLDPDGTLVTNDMPEAIVGYLVSELISHGITGELRNTKTGYAPTDPNDPVSTPENFINNVNLLNELLPGLGFDKVIDSYKKQGEGLIEPDSETRLYALAAGLRAYDRFFKDFDQLPAMNEYPGEKLGPSKEELAFRNSEPDTNLHAASCKVEKMHNYYNGIQLH